MLIGVNLVYNGIPSDILKGASDIRVISYKHERVVSRRIKHSLEDLHWFEKVKNDFLLLVIAVKAPAARSNKFNTVAFLLLLLR